MTAEYGSAPDDYLTRIVNAVVKAVAEESIVTAADGNRYVVLHSNEIIEAFMDMIAWQAASTKAAETDEGREEIVAAFKLQFGAKLAFHRDALEQGAYGAVQIVHLDGKKKQ